MTRLHPAVLFFFLLAALSPVEVEAQGFAAYISPPRYELRLKAGQSHRQVLEIQHVGRDKGHYRVYTNEWNLGADNAPDFSDALAPDSCRPWVAIERRELSLEPGARYRFRFEVTPPVGTAPRECRFAIMVEGSVPVQVPGAVSFPVGGRIGVIVYASIDGAAAQLRIMGTETIRVEGKSVPQLTVHNAGNATGRLEGFVDGTDAQGQNVELTPADLPVLPGETQRIALTPVPVGNGQTTPILRFPLRVKGSLESGPARLPLDVSFGP